MSSPASPASIVVVGSVNADVYIEIDRLPQAGETLEAKEGSGVVLPGGKGANTAVGVARLLHSSSSAGAGASAGARFVGKFGNDSHGAMLRRTMESYRVDLSLSQTVDVVSGSALILLQSSGENSIVLIGGANRHWPEISDGAGVVALPAPLQRAIRESRLILLQREIPERVNLAIAAYARSVNVRVMLDMGGEASVPSASLLRGLFLLAPNETELARITRLPCDTREQVVVAARLLQTHMGVQHVLVTLGSRGALLFLPDAAADAVLEHPCFPVRVVDTTGAGDTFRAAFAVSLVEGRAWLECLAFASAAAALCVTKKGAMPAIPSREETEAFMRKQQRASAQQQSSKL